MNQKAKLKQYKGSGEIQYLNLEEKKIRIILDYQNGSFTILLSKNNIQDILKYNLERKSKIYVVMILDKGREQLEAIMSLGEKQNAKSRRKEKRSFKRVIK